ncbi:Ataxin 2-like [Goodea atripinnis]|uniref:Ataxin 2-like n=1 Tax=Goodea atripinnis TaxID=208336 RepID=A0ABV0P2X4_9TELE
MRAVRRYAALLARPACLHGPVMLQLKAHRKSPERSIGPRKEDIVESLIFKASDVVVVTFKDVDLNFARKGIKGFYGELALLSCFVSTNQSNGWDPNDMFKYNEEKYGVLSTYDSSLSTYTVPLERNDSEEFLKREARAAQLAEEIEASATYKARVALENDERSEEEKYTAVVRGERETQSLSRSEEQGSDVMGCRTTEFTSSGSEFSWTLNFSTRTS